MIGCRPAESIFTRRGGVNVEHKPSAYGDVRHGRIEGVRAQGMYIAHNHAVGACISELRIGDRPRGGGAKGIEVYPAATGVPLPLIGQSTG